MVPYGPSPPPIQPNERAAKIADYFRVVIYLHMALALACFLGTRYIDGVLDLLGAVVGYMSIRNPDGFNFQYILCYVTFCVFVFFYAIVTMILFFAGSTSASPSATWQLNIYVATLVAGPVIYICGAVLGYHLYKELRSMMMPDGMAAGDQQQGGGGGSYIPQENAADSWRHQEIHPDGGVAAVSGGSRATSASNTSGFRAFSGQGHKLGGT